MNIFDIDNNGIITILKVDNEKMWSLLKISAFLPILFIIYKTITRKLYYEI